MSIEDLRVVGIVPHRDRPVAHELARSAATWLRDRGLEVGTGEFGARMMVEIHNDGPVTLILERKA